MSAPTCCTASRCTSPSGPTWSTRPGRTPSWPSRCSRPCRFRTSSRRTSATPCCSWPPTRPATSPACSCAWTPAATSSGTTSTSERQGGSICEGQGRPGALPGSHALRHDRPEGIRARRGRRPFLAHQRRRPGRPGGPGGRGRPLVPGTGDFRLRGCGVSADEILDDAQRKDNERKKNRYHFDRHTPEYRHQFETVTAELQAKCPIAWSDTYGGHWVASGNREVFELARSAEYLSNDHDVNNERRG